MTADTTTSDAPAPDNPAPDAASRPPHLRREPAAPPAGVAHRVLSFFPEPAVTDAEVAARLATPLKRLTAHLGLLFGDHHILRVAFQNAHAIDGEMWRSNQPSPAQLDRWAARGIKTVINLRGLSRKSFHVLERDACDRLGLELVTLRVNSRHAPWPVVPRMIRDLFATIRYPALMHCKSGADRAGLMGVFYRHFQLGEPVSAALQQLSPKYLHLRGGKTGVLDAYFEAYVREGEARGLSLIEWSEGGFDPKAFKAAYRPSALGSLLTDILLRRE